MIYVLGRRHSLDCYFKATSKKKCQFGFEFAINISGRSRHSRSPEGGRQAGGFLSSPSQLKCTHTTLPDQCMCGPNRDKMFLSDADACAVARDHDRALPLRENLGMSFVPSPAPHIPILFHMIVLHLAIPRSSARGADEQ